MTDIEADFSEAMMQIYLRARSEANYNATRYHQMLVAGGGLRTAQTLLHADNVSDGYTALWERKRLDLTVEALILDNPKYHLLFDAEEIEIARYRLAQYKYPSALTHG